MRSRALLVVLLQGIGACSSVSTNDTPNPNSGGASGGTAGSGGAAGSSSECVKLLANGTFEGGTVGWHPYASATLSAVSPGHESNNAMLVATTQPYGAAEFWDITAPLPPDHCVSASMFHRLPAGGVFPDGTSAALRESTSAFQLFSLPIVVSVDSEWTALSYECRPASATSFDYEMEFGVTLNSPGEILIDDVVIELCPCSSGAPTCEN